jgi:predicted Zn-dependent protease
VDPDVTGDLPRSPRRQEILVHEVGHLLSLMHADGAPTAANPNGGVMRPSCCPANTRQSSNFTDQSLHKLRSIAEPD